MGNKTYAMEWMEKAYHDLDSAPNKELPSKDEIQKVIDISEYLFNKTCKVLELNKDSFQ